jgi:hypothetical protein
MSDLTLPERELLTWLGNEAFSQYGECHGAALDALVAKGFAQVHGPGEHQDGFLAKDPHGEKSMLYRAVSLTEMGRDQLRADKLLVEICDCIASWSGVHFQVHHADWAEGNKVLEITPEGVKTLGRVIDSAVVRKGG